LINEDILVECFRTSTSFFNHRISPLTKKYEPPRLSPFERIIISRHQPGRWERGEGETNPPSSPSTFPRRHLGKIVRKGNFYCTDRQSRLIYPTGPKKGSLSKTASTLTASSSRGGLHSHNPKNDAQGEYFHR